MALIADVGKYPVSTLTRSQRLADDLGYDSLLQLRLLDRLRAQYPQLQHVDVIDVLPNIGNVGGLVDFVVHELKRVVRAGARTPARRTVERPSSRDFGDDVFGGGFPDERRVVQVQVPSVVTFS